MIQTFHCTQYMDKPTRGESILDLIFSGKEFSIFGSNSRKGPWSKLQSDKLKQGKTGLQNLDIAAFKTLRVREKQDLEKEIEKETEVGFVFQINNM